ncbi:MAG: acyltransferase family protein [Actinomycetota bacterium]|nr:acyltransferase family protein [Actinomycetota bacterium]
MTATPERTAPGHLPTEASGHPWLLDRGRRAGEMGYLPGLDGVRALAVIGVLLYHADLTWISGGFLGVDVFFVLSGFLITTLILEEYERSGGIRFSRFYLGRARRLLPALILMLAVVAVAAAVVYRDVAAQVRADTVASVFYVNNWWYVFNEQSYFEFIGRPPLLKHLWSLAVEEQFYLIWPAVAFLIMRKAGRPGVRWFAIALAVLSTAWMIWLSATNGYPEYADPSRAYFGTDSHAMGLLIGAALATFWRPGRLPSSVPRGGVTILTGTGIAALLAVVWFFLFVGEFTPWMYRGGFLVLALVVALLIAMSTHPASPLGRWMGSQPWRYIGQRSYGLYLWHWPVFMVTRPSTDVPLDGVPLLVVRLAITFVIAEASFRFVEMPIRRGAIDRWVKAWRESTGDEHNRQSRRGGAVIGTAVAGIVALGLVLAAVPAPTAAAGLAPDVAEAMGLTDGGPTEVTLDDPATPAPTTGPTGPTPEPAATPGPSGSPAASATTPPAASRGTISALGDSVMLGARSTLVDVIPGARVDAAVSRFPGAFVGRIKKLRAQDKLADTVVLHAATNGVLPADMLREMLDLLSGYGRVVVVNASVPRSWEEPNNDAIADVVPEFPNAVIADWKEASRGHPEYFVSDGVHLTKAGAKAYATLIKKAAGV